MCLEAYINGFVEDHLRQWRSHIKRMELTAKWLLVPAFLSRPDCFSTGSQPYQDFALLIRRRNNDLAHYKHEFHPPVELRDMGTVSEIHAICNADNARKAVETVRQMIYKINEHLNLPIPSWVRETNGADWLSVVDM